MPFHDSAPSHLRRQRDAEAGEGLWTLNDRSLLHLHHTVFELLDVLCGCLQRTIPGVMPMAAQAGIAADLACAVGNLRCVDSRGFRLLDLIDVLLQQDDNGFCQ